MNNEKLLCDYQDTMDITIRNQILENNIPLVRHIAAKFYNSSYYEYDYDDLVSFGIFGLITAIEKYDASKKTKFSTFAYQKIYYSIIDELRRVDTIPRTIRRKLQLVKKDIEILENIFGCNVNVVELAQDYDLSVSDLHVLEGTYVSSTEIIGEDLYDKRGLYSDNVLCGCSFRTSLIS